MNESSPLPSLVQLQFRRAKVICTRNVPVGQQNTDKANSSAQVETSVGQHVVGQKSCGLKPNESKLFRITTRFSETEREILVRQAENSRLTVSEYIRASVLGTGYVSSIDPVRRKLLLDANRELGRQGTNLNQIAKHLNAGIVSPEQGDSTLALLARSLLAAHKTVRQALAEGRSES